MLLLKGFYYLSINTWLSSSLATKDMHNCTSSARIIISTSPVGMVLQHRRVSPPSAVGPSVHYRCSLAAWLGASVGKYCRPLSCMVQASCTESLSHVGRIQKHYLICAAPPCVLMRLYGYTESWPVKTVGSLPTLCPRAPKLPQVRVCGGTFVKKI